MNANEMDADVERLRARVAVLERMLEQREKPAWDFPTQLEQALDELRQREWAPASAEQTLPKQRSLMQQVLDRIGEGIVIADERGNFQVFNPAAERIMGIGPLQVPPDEWPVQYGLFLPDQVTPYATRDLPLVRAIRGEEVDEVEIFMRHSRRLQGIWLKVNARPLRDEHGQLRGGVAVIRDVTEQRRAELRLNAHQASLLIERKEAEEALRRSEALYHSLVENLPIGVFRKDLKGRFTFGNRRFCDELGRRLDEVLAKTDYDFYPKELAEKYASDDRKVCETGTIFEDVEGHQKPDGERLFVHVMKVPIRDFLGRIVETQGMYWDVTARVRAEEELKRVAQELARSNDELRQFASVVSHDLHEPLRALTSFGRILQRRYQGRLDAEADEHLAFIVDGAARMQELLDDLLEYTRVGAPVKPFQPTDCGAVLDRALANLQIFLQESGALVTRDPLPAVLGDAPQLVQLYQNLIANAVKFRGPEAPRIHATARRQGDFWLCSVRDNGIGIDTRDAERIFVIFQRLHTREQYEGSGIGLAVCKKIIERQGGRIWVESRRGQGSTFYFTLPAV